MPLAPRRSPSRPARLLAATALALSASLGAGRKASAEPAQACLEATAGQRCSLGDPDRQTGFCMRELDRGPLRCLSGMSMGGLPARPLDRAAPGASLSVGPFLQAPAGAPPASSSGAHLPTLSIAPELDVTPPGAPSPAGGWLAFALSNSLGLVGLGLVIRTRREGALSLDEA